MRLAAVFALLLLVASVPAIAGPRSDSSPLAKSSPTVPPCLNACETEFARCESRPAATTKICPESRLACVVRCDPAVLSSETLRALRRTPEELRYKPINPMSPVEQCRQGCQDRRAVCLTANSVFACDPATTACYDQCDATLKAPAAKKKPRKSAPAPRG